MQLHNRYFLMRHGQSQANVEDLIISAPEIGCVGYGLTTLGREQARLSASQSGLGPQTVVIHSDFLRTQETAQEAAEVLGVSTIRADMRLRERYFGQLDQTVASNYHKVWSLDDQDAPMQWGVESGRHLVARLMFLMAELEDASRGQTFLLVSHGDPLRFLQCSAAFRALSKHQSIAHFGPAEVRQLEHIVDC